MPTTTTPDNITGWTASDPASLVQESQTQAASIQAAFAKRERYDYVWANAAERTAETGMVQGSRGYQVDTKAEWSYDNSNWRLATPHAEFTSTRSVPTGGYRHPGTFSIQSSASTDLTFVTPSGSGGLNIVRPGIYSLSFLATWPATSTADNLALISTTTATESNTIPSGVVTQQRVIGGLLDFSSVVFPNFNVTVANTVMYLVLVQNAAGAQTVNARAYVTRLG